MARSTQHPRENPSSDVTGRKTPPASATDARHPRPSHLRVAGTPKTSANEAGDALDEGLDETFPASDPVSATRRSSS